MLEEKYNRYALLNERVLQVAKRELKELWSRPMWCLFWIQEERKGRTVEMLRFKLFRKKCHERQNYNWFTFRINSFSKFIWNYHQTKNDAFVKTLFCSCRNI
jgi:hypothetical protein